MSTTREYLIDQYETAFEKGWDKRHDDIARIALGKPKPKRGVSSRESNVTSGTRALVRVLINIWNEARGLAKTGQEAINKDGYVVGMRLNLSAIAARAGLKDARSVSELLKPGKLKRIFETGYTWKVEWKFRIRWDLICTEMTAFSGSRQCGQQPSTLSSVQSDSAAAPSASEDKDKRSLRDLVPLVKKKVQSYQDLSQEPRILMDLLVEQFSPKIESIPGKTFALLQRLANDPAPRRRMTVDLLRTVLDKMNNFPDLFEDRQLRNDLEHFVRYWHTYLRVINHAQAADAAADSAVSSELDRLPSLVRNLKKTTPAIAVAFVRALRDVGDRMMSEIALALVQGNPVKTALLKAKEYLLERPCIYQGVYHLIGNLPDLLEISDEQHLRLVKAARSAILRAEISTALEAHYA